MYSCIHAAMHYGPSNLGVNFGAKLIQGCCMWFQIIQTAVDPDTRKHFLGGKWCNSHTHTVYICVYIFTKKVYIYIYTYIYILYMHWIPFLSCQFPCPFPFHSIHTYGDGLKPIIPYFGGLYNIHLPALLIFTMVTGIWLMSMYCDEPLNIKA